MSSQAADDSSSLSLLITGAANSLLRALFGPGAFQLTEEAVRKAAHFLEYLVLGFLLFNAFAKGPRQLVRTFLYAVIAGVLFAVSDEAHQNFVPGRTMSPLDVLVDSAGIITAIALMTGCAYRRRVNGQCILNDGRPEGGRDLS